MRSCFLLSPFCTIAFLLIVKLNLNIKRRKTLSFILKNVKVDTVVTFYTLILPVICLFVYLCFLQKTIHIYQFSVHFFVHTLHIVSVASCNYHCNRSGRFLLLCFYAFFNFYSHVTICSYRHAKISLFKPFLRLSFQC